MAPVKECFLAAILIALSTSCAMRSGPSGPSGLSDPINEVSVRAHMEFLASDAMNGRGSGTRDEWIAVTYVAAQLRRWGLEPMGADGGYVQTIEIERAELAAPPALTVGSTRFTHGAGVTVGAMSLAESSGPLATYAKGTPVARGSAVFVPAMSPEIQPDLAPAALVLTAAGGCGPGRAPQGGL